MTSFRRTVAVLAAWGLAGAANGAGPAAPARRASKGDRATTATVILIRDTRPLAEGRDDSRRALFIDRTAPGGTRVIWRFQTQDEEPEL